MTLGTFRIAFTGDFFEDDPAIAIGEIRLGEHGEYFHATLGFWAVGDYEASWLEGVRHTVAGADTSCLVTSMTDPAITNFVPVWPLYRSSDEVRVQNHLIFPGELNHDFDPSAPWNSIKGCETTDENGNKISEWLVSVTDLAAFLSEGAR